MQDKVRGLFKLLESGNLEQFKKCLTPEVVNCARVYVLDSYNYRFFVSQRLSRREVQREYLIHQAIKMNSAEALLHCLNNGANLLQRERYDHHNYIDIASGKPEPLLPCQNGDEIVSYIENYYHHNNKKNRLGKPEVHSYESGTALYRITCFQDKDLIQIAFDYICEHRLYEKEPDYIEFLATHLATVNRAKFRLEYLKIDVGNFLPDYFEDTHDYKKCLSDLGFDVSKLFFFKTDYSRYFTERQNPADAQLLQHALRVCEFSLEELKTLYQALVPENLKWVMISYNSQIDPELSAQLAAKLNGDLTKTKPTKKRELSPDIIDDYPRSNSIPSDAKKQKEDAILPHHIQEFKHLQQRIPRLTQTISDLRNKIDSTNKKKIPAKITKELELAKNSLQDAQNRLLKNPYYQQQKSLESDDNEEKKVPAQDNLKL
jgi:hypothetical protein